MVVSPNVSSANVSIFSETSGNILAELLLKVCYFSFFYCKDTKHTYKLEMSFVVFFNATSKKTIVQQLPPIGSGMRHRGDCNSPQVGLVWSCRQQTATPFL